MQENGKPLFQLDIKFDYSSQCPPVSSSLQDSYWLPMDGIIDADEFHDLDIQSKQSSFEQVFSDLPNAKPQSQNIVKQEEIVNSADSYSDDEKSIFPLDDSNSKDEEVVTSLKKPFIEKTRHIKKKRRLKGNELINSIIQDPLFSKHTQLLDKKLDDASRKKMMQKIRNRISAQESRDRRKIYIESIEQNNLELLNENYILKESIKKLKEEN